MSLQRNGEPGRAGAGRDLWALGSEPNRLAGSEVSARGSGLLIASQADNVVPGPSSET